MADDDILGALFQVRAHCTATIARADPDSDEGQAELRELQAKVDRVNEAINWIVAKGFTAPVEQLKQANAQLAAYNRELAADLEANQKLKSALAIAAKVLDVIAQVASFA